MKTNQSTTVSKMATVVALLFSSLIFSQGAYKSELNTIFETFITKDFQLLDPILQKHKREALLRNKISIAQQICLVPSPESYTVVKSETIGYNERVTVQYQYADKLRTHYFTFDRKKRLIAIEVALKTLKLNREQYSLL